MDAATEAGNIFGVGVDGGGLPALVAAGDRKELSLMKQAEARLDAGDAAGAQVGAALFPWCSFHGVLSMVFFP